MRTRLAAAALSPTLEMGVAEELAQHLHDRYCQYCAEGLEEAEAAAKSLSEIDGPEWLTDLGNALEDD